MILGNRIIKNYGSTICDTFITTNKYENNINYISNSDRLCLKAFVLKKSNQLIHISEYFIKLEIAFLT